MSRVASVGQGEYWQTAKPLLLYSYVQDFRPPIDNWDFDQICLNTFIMILHPRLTHSRSKIPGLQPFPLHHYSSTLWRLKQGWLPYESQLMFFSTCFKVDSTPFLLKRFVCECGSNAKLEVAWLPLTNDRALNWSAFHEGWRKAYKWPTIDKRNAHLQNMISLINIDL